MEAMQSLVRNGFEVADQAGELIVRCRVCKSGWSLKPSRGSDYHDGNVLHLIDHAAGHGEGVEPSPDSGKKR